MDTQKNDTNNKQKIHPVAAAVTGAVIGAGVAVAGVVALKDEKNREKVKKVLGSVKDQALSYMDDMQKTANKKQAEVKKTVAHGKKSAKKLIHSTKAAA